MTKLTSGSVSESTSGSYAKPTLVTYGKVLEMTASGTQPPTENTGTGGAIKRP